MKPEKNDYTLRQLLTKEEYMAVLSVRINEESKLSQMLKYQTKLLDRDKLLLKIGKMMMFLAKGVDDSDETRDICYKISLLSSKMFDPHALNGAVHDIQIECNDSMIEIARLKGE
jgi:hypothetical protein